MRPTTFSHYALRVLIYAGPATLDRYTLSDLMLTKHDFNAPRARA